jgi:hypothetical protein
MKRLAALLALTGAFAVAACDEPRSSDEDSLADKAAEQPLAPTAEDAGVPAEAVTPTPPPPTDATTIPPEKRSSEESVKPESETLFY